jgi:hypothetical protein
LQPVNSDGSPRKPSAASNDATPCPYTIDLHWQVANSPALSTLFDVEEFFARAVPLPRLADAAMATDPVLTFLHGCLNQALHQHYGFYVESGKLRGEVRLIWLLDNHLLASAFSGAQWHDLVRIMLDRGLAPICLPLIEQTVRMFGTPVPEDVLARLRDAPADSQVQQYIRGDSELARFIADVRACHGWRGRLNLVLARAFPGRDQVNERFPALAGWPLPVLYVMRLVAGPFRLLAGRRRR